MLEHLRSTQKTTRSIRREAQKYSTGSLEAFNGIFRALRALEDVFRSTRRLQDSATKSSGACQTRGTDVEYFRIRDSLWHVPYPVVTTYAEVKLVK